MFGDCLPKTYLNKGKTPLELAVDVEHKEFIEYLKRHGAKRDVKRIDCSLK